jgi:hypothetical protein
MGLDRDNELHAEVSLSFGGSNKCALTRFDSSPSQSMRGISLAPMEKSPADTNLGNRYV